MQKRSALEGKSLTYTFKPVPWYLRSTLQLFLNKAWAEAIQGQKDEETCCSGRYKASQICYSQGKKRYYTEIWKQPQNKVCLEWYKHSNHKRPHQLLLRVISHYKHLQTVLLWLWWVDSRSKCFFFQFLLFVAPRKKKSAKIHDIFSQSSFLK